MYNYIIIIIIILNTKIKGWHHSISSIWAQIPIGMCYTQKNSGPQPPNPTWLHKFNQGHYLENLGHYYACFFPWYVCNFKWWQCEESCKKYLKTEALLHCFTLRIRLSCFCDRFNLDILLLCLEASCCTLEATDPFDG